jgi:hypothetical protein
MQISQFYLRFSCLDRTNVAQFSAGVEAIGHQLVVMGIRSKGKLGPSSSFVRVLIDLYVDIGDSIALQYGGSEAHKKVTAGVSETIAGPIGKVSSHYCNYDFATCIFLPTPFDKLYSTKSCLLR